MVANGNKEIAGHQKNFDLVLHVQVDLRSISDKFQSQTHSKVLSLVNIALQFQFHLTALLLTVTVCGSSENMHCQNWKQKQKNNVWNEHCF